MPTPQGLHSGIHAPAHSNGNVKNQTFDFHTSAGIGMAGSMHNPANAAFTFSAAHPNGSGSYATTPSTRPTTPACQNQEPHQSALTVCPPNIGKGQAHTGRLRQSLRLQKVSLVGSHSALPHFSIDEILLQYTGHGMPFSIDTLAAGIAQSCSVGALRQYISCFGREDAGKIHGLVKDRHPVLFYAVERNCVACVRLLLDAGSTVKNPVGVAKLLLAFGATPQAVPADMWQNYLEQPSSRAPDHDGELDPVARWRTAHDRLILESALNLSIRYYLHKASQISIAKQRGVQLAQAHSYLALLKVPYLIIGQDYATKRVLDVVSTHLGMQVASPLVLVFPGLSGHGKTELAKQMGNLLQLPMTIIDCAQIHSQIALFGSRLGYQGNSQGSQLNNHLAEHSGARSVVFLDGFDKTDRDVHNSLLLLLDSGEYHDHRNNKPVDASKTIWIMATNLEDREITNFYRNHLENGTPGQKADAPYSNLTEQLKSRFRDVFGPPMAGRRKNVAPFFPFDKNEQAVVVHKFILELVEQVRNPIDTSCFSKHYPGHVHLALKNDGKLCAHLAGESYIEELGARSLIAGIDDVRIAFFTSFTDTDELVSDGMNDGALMKFTAQLQPFSREDDEGSALGRVIVARDGYTSYYAGQGTEDADTGSDDGVDGLNDTLFKMMGDDIDL